MIFVWNIDLITIIIFLLQESKIWNLDLITIDIFSLQESKWRHCAVMGGKPGPRPRLQLRHAEDPWTADPGGHQCPWTRRRPRCASGGHHFVGALLHPATPRHHCTTTPGIYHHISYLLPHQVYITTQVYLNNFELFFWPRYQFFMSLDTKYILVSRVTALYQLVVSWYLIWLHKYEINFLYFYA